MKSVYSVEGVHDRSALEDLLSLVKGAIVIDLNPEVDECYALGPYSVSYGEKWETATFGDFMHRAKYGKDQGAVAAMSEGLAGFAHRHPRLGAVATVVAPPKSDSKARNVPLQWAQSVAETLGARTVDVQKVVATTSQKNLQGLEEQEAAARVANTMSALAPIKGDVLIIDDTVRSGGTLKEVGRALRHAGAKRVYGLCVAKDAKFTNGWIDLSKERWA